MFYSQYILARKGPLGKIWLAAHFEKKLTKSQVFATDISESVQTIVNPAVPLALRVSGHLMLGIVRIYSDKVRYLITDCRDAMTKINLAFKASTARVDVDVAGGGKIDDTNYANLPFDEQEQYLTTTSYQHAVGRASKPIPKLDESGYTSFFAVGDIELLRHEESRQSIIAERPEMPSSRRTTIGAQMDEDLPAFDGENLFQGNSFGMYEPFDLDVDMNPSASATAPAATEATLPPSSSVAMSATKPGIVSSLPSFVEEASSHRVEPIEITLQSSQLHVRETKHKRRKIEINDKIEVSDKVWKQRLHDVSSIVRPVPSLHASRTTNVRLDYQDITGAMHLCPELQEVALFLSDPKWRHRTDTTVTMTTRETAEEEVPEITRRHETEFVDTMADKSFQPLHADRRESLASISGVNTSLRQSFPMAFDGGDLSGGFDYDFPMNVSGTKDSRHSYVDSTVRGVLPQAIQDKLFRPDEATAAMEGLDNVDATNVVGGVSSEVSVERSSERTNMVYSYLQEQLAQPTMSKGKATMAALVGGCSKTIAARFFLETLQLTTWGKLEMKQPTPRGDIFISLT